MRLRQRCIVVQLFPSEAGRVYMGGSVAGDRLIQLREMLGTCFLEILLAKALTASCLTRFRRIRFPERRAFSLDAH